MPATHLFGPLDCLRLKRLQSEAVSLELEADILSSGSSLRRAVTGMAPLARRGAFAILSDNGESGVGGFVEARWRKDLPEADLRAISPGLDKSNGAALTWHSLVSGACSHFGSQGGQRVYVALSQDDLVALQVFRQLGFAAYATDTVFRRPPGPPPEGVESSGAPEETLHRAAITRLYLESAPESVQVHEEPTGAAWRRYPMGGWAGGAVGRAVWLGSQGDVQAAWRLYRGPAGYWLHMVAGAACDPLPPIQSAVASLPGASRLPVYCAARGHETHLNLSLRDAGFEPLVVRFRLVKHTTARVFEPAWSASTLQDRRLDPAASGPITPSHSAGQSAPNLAARRTSPG